LKAVVGFARDSRPSADASCRALRGSDVRIVIAACSLALLSGCIVATEGATPFGPVRHPASTTAGPHVTYTSETRRQIAGLVVARSRTVLRNPWIFGPVALLDPRSTPALPVYSGDQLYCVAVDDGSGAMRAIASFHVDYRRGSPVVTPEWRVPICAGPATPFPELAALSAWAAGQAF
jgi:hypothetical protein